MFIHINKIGPATYSGTKTFKDFRSCLSIHSLSLFLTMPVNSKCNPNSSVMISESHQDDDGNHRLPPTCASRANSSTLPCQHCYEEQNDRERRNQRARLCYYCHRPGHKIYECKSKENDEATQLINQAVNAGIQTQRRPVEDRNEMIVTGTEGGLWGDIWYVSNSFSHHYAGNLNVFKRIKHLVGVGE
ncbi:putative transcription factor interactor and regulator CCHC(Zn) family [Helianthus annuus]|nr:putative transcription factor interactor and regulator CCHC(Zn) family [Helianthus annuus]KAJ0598797.1 putative transcription factor interactor and regulator CCHC(Zn) family [Helianthus annuus]KAJ0763052.1 putative transcription factor interactor and regulator CCHC(Zn) family [Helianthus annuus]KAJ0929006.1 putative transcription factor interactor and regulator CCHC(Zn) family [Helianthus annuus]KAJ0933361.1 putative transcription factor interactor and regulator CCHC(Zn) family [Helianthus a